MKVKKIIPCVCIEHYPETADSCGYGMPNIAVGQGEWFSCYCRNCGRGSRFLQWQSTYKALKDWNKIQKSCWERRCYKAFSARYRDNIAEWEKRILRDFEIERSESE